MNTTSRTKSRTLEESGLAEKILLKFFCYAPPGRSYDPEQDDPTLSSAPQLTDIEKLERDYGPELTESLANSSLLDIGCGKGEHLLGALRAGARRAVGVDIRPLFTETEQLAHQEGLGERLTFTVEPLSNLESESFDIIISRDTFEHFDDPAAILREAERLLKPGGRFFVSFGPPWYHPRGVHMFFMFKRPWAHLLFSERTIMNVRSLYKDDNSRKYCEVPGGLNQMTVSRFIRLITDSGLNLQRLAPVAIKGLTPLARIPMIREFFTSIVQATLKKKSRSL